jgi:soluble lytic murein transglycosylase-like protein
MNRLLPLTLFAAIAVLPWSQAAHAGRAEYEAMIATHAAANAVPVALVHRVIVRESRYQPALVGRGGTIGLMQIKLATARGLGYTGDAAGLRDPNTNLAYGVKYLAGAYRAANGDHGRAVHYYASGYYEAAKRQRHQRVAASGIESSGNPVAAPATAQRKLAGAGKGPAEAPAPQVPAR